MSSICRLGIAMFCGAVLTACAYEGRVTDQATGKPLEGVVVIGVWRGVQAMPAEARSLCYRLETAISDASGRFSLPSFSFNLNPTLTERTFRIQEAYKPGYSLLMPAAAGHDLVMIPNPPASAEAVAKVLSRKLPYDCPDVDVAEKLGGVMLSMYKEALSLAKSDRDVEAALGMLNMYEGVTLGQEKAAKNKEKRESERDRAKRSYFRADDSDGTPQKMESQR